VPVSESNTAAGAEAPPAPATFALASVRPPLALPTERPRAAVADPRPPGAVADASAAAALPADPWAWSACSVPDGIVPELPEPPPPPPAEAAPPPEWIVPVGRPPLAVGTFSTYWLTPEFPGGAIRCVRAPLPTPCPNAGPGTTTAAGRPSAAMQATTTRFIVIRYAPPRPRLTVVGRNQSTFDRAPAPGEAQARTSGSSSECLPPADSERSSG